MYLSQGVLYLYLVSSLICFLGPWFYPLSGESALDSVSMLAGGIFCLLVAVLLRLSRGTGKSVMVVSAAAIWMAFVLRLLYMILGPYSYAFGFSHLGTWYSADVTKALLFMGLGTVGWWLGSNWSQRRGVSGVTDGQMAEAVYTERSLLILVSLVAVVVRSLLRFGGNISFSLEATSQYGYLLRLLPTDALFLALSYLAVRHWRRLQTAHRWAIGLYAGLYFIDLFGAGTRSALFQPIVVLFLVGAWLFSDIRLPVIRAAVTMGLLLLIFPQYLGIALFLRDVVRLSGGQVLEIPTLLESLRVITNRFTGLEALMVVMNMPPDALSEYVSVRSVMQSTLGAIVPDRFLHSSVPSLGKVFGVLYQGMPWEIQHDGAFYGFGIFFALWKWWGAVFLGVYAYVVGGVLRWVNGNAVFSGWAPLYVMQNMVWMTFMSGNLDSLLATMLTQSFLVAALLWVSRRLRIRFSVTGRSDGSAMVSLQEGIGGISRI